MFVKRIVSARGGIFTYAAQILLLLLLISSMLLSFVNAADEADHNYIDKQKELRKSAKRTTQTGVWLTVLLISAILLCVCFCAIGVPLLVCYFVRKRSQKMRDDEAAEAKREKKKNKHKQDKQLNYNAEGHHYVDDEKDEDKPAETTTAKENEDFDDIV